MYGILTFLLMWLSSIVVNAIIFNDLVRGCFAGLVSTIVTAIVLWIFANIIDDEES